MGLHSECHIQHWSWIILNQNDFSSHDLDGSRIFMRTIESKYSDVADQVFKKKIQMIIQMVDHAWMD